MEVENTVLFADVSQNASCYWYLKLGRVTLRSFSVAADRVKQRSLEEATSDYPPLVDYIGSSYSYLSHSSRSPNYRVNGIGLPTEGCEFEYQSYYAVS